MTNLGVDIGASKTLVARFDRTGGIVDMTRTRTEQHFSLFKRQLLETIEVLGGDEVMGAVGVAAPGLIDYGSRTIRRAGNLPWTHVPLERILGEELGAPVLVDNDANVGALQEARRGAGFGHRTVLYITISTGIGTGVVIDGEIDPALANSEGGQMHFRHKGQLTRWERFASGSAFVERYGRLGSEVDDPDVWDEWSADVSLGVGALLAMINPDIVVIGGSMGTHLDKYRDRLCIHLETARSPLIEIPPIVAAADPEHAVISGCFLLAERAASARH